MLDFDWSYINQNIFIEFSAFVQQSWGEINSFREDFGHDELFLCIQLKIFQLVCS